jgi:PilZ domain-containing protein
MSDSATIATPRRHERIELPRGMMVAWYGGGEQRFSRVGTIGAGGLFICEPNALPIGTKLRLTFQVPGGDAEAVVRNIVPGKGMGVEFLRIPPRDKILLDRLLKRLLR